VALTDVKIRNAKPTGKDYKLADGHGVYLLVAASGSKLWRWKYRFAGKEKLMALGAYPEVTLAAARDKFAGARTILDSGVDPMADRKKGREKAETTFRVVALDWLKKWKADKDQRYVMNAERRLTDYVLARIGDRSIDEIQAPELVRMVCAIEERGASDVARRALQMTSQVFRYGIAHGLCRQNPAAMFKPSDVLKKVKVENFARVEKSELPDLITKIEYYDGSPVTRLAMKLMALVFLRTSELIEGQWAEVDWKEARWNIPKERMKGGKRPHFVPLSAQAITVLQQLWHYRKNDIWMFPGDRANECMSNNTILKALERIGYKGKMTGHGFRGIASTLLHEYGFENEHIELQLAHAPHDDVAAAYNHAKYLKSRRKMMQWWAEYLDQMIESGKASPTVNKTSVASLQVSA